MSTEVENTALIIEMARPPLTTDPQGVVKISNSRITLDTVIMTFEEGATAEEIVYQYPALDLADVYAVIGYYLQKQEEVEEYLHRREAQRLVVREQNEARFNPQGIRDRLLARKA